ncbi:MAG: hypothetical protein JNL08_13990 [Planctomycetes bacterium]|nr:hypothetical protein [Planctomycetota bacterium]
MAIRKEQVLVLVTLAVGAWIAKSLLAEPARSATFQPSKIEYAAKAVAPTVLATDAPRPGGRADFCTEPSETRPLPPRVLDFPPHAPLSVAAVPLEIGPDHGHLWAVRLDGTPVEGVTIQTVAEAAPDAAAAAPPDGDAPQGSDRAALEERAARTYDRIWVRNQKAPHWGAIEPDGRDLFELEEKRDFEGVEVRMRLYKLSEGKLGSLITYGKDPALQIERIELAATLRNQVQRRVRRVPALASHHEERRALIEWLLEQARTADWVYDVAIEQADIYRQVSHGDLEGYRLQQRVLQARGDLAGEFALLDGLQGDFRESAFRYEGLGVVKARLGLVREAEQDLRRAVELAPNDARPHAALAEFLRRQDRSTDALVAGRNAERTFGSLQNAADRVRVARAIVACHLAVADVDAARNALSLVPAEQPQPYLVGCVAYAAGDLGMALAAFRQASSGLDGGAAQLGQAACLLRQGQWQEAHDLFVRTADQEPLLRHRAATGLALLFTRLGQFDSASAWLDRAFEAAPTDAYAFYLRGRALRLQGQLAAAAEAQSAALREHDDFVHAIAEMAAVQGQRAQEGRGNDQAEAAIAAKRYADRAVALVHQPAVELFELQGLHHFAAADARGARAAFLAARDLAATEADKLFAKGGTALVDYSRGLVEDATAALQRLVDDLPKDAPMRAWADATLAAIYDHAEKELLEDGFARSEVGNVWGGERDGSNGAAVQDDALVFRVPAGRFGGGEMTAERTGAVQNGKNFLAVGCTLQLGAAQSAAEGEAGLRIELQRGGGTHELRAMVGVREGQPYVRIQDGREDDVKLTPTIAGFDRTGEQRLELRAVPRGELQSRQLTLQVWWNGQLLAQHELKTLTGNTAGVLKTVLFAGGPKGAAIDVRFDDYRLERRKGR